MRLKEIQAIFHVELDAIYNPNEVDSFFYLLIEHFANLKRIDLALEPEYAILKEEEQPFFEALSRLKLEEPIQYIIGETEFYELPFKINEHTLIPRPETEELVDWIIKSYSEPSDESQIKILDIGTGSGCIPVSLAKNLPKSKVYALDISVEALKTAKDNAELNKVAVEFFETDILNHEQKALLPEGQKFDVIVSNPPYVRNLEKSEMKPNVLKHEPELALFVEDDNALVFYKTISEFAQNHLKTGGKLYFEINQYLGEEIVALLKSFNFIDVELRKDMFGNNRMIKGVKP